MPSLGRLVHVVGLLRTASTLTTSRSGAHHGNRQRRKAAAGADVEQRGGLFRDEVHTASESKRATSIASRLTDGGEVDHRIPFRQEGQRFDQLIFLLFARL